jgi:hypothetical protein
MKRKGLILLLTIIFTFGLLGTAGADYDDPWLLPDEPPRILIGKDAQMPVFTAGEKVKLRIPLENTGRTDARDLSISLSGGDADGFPFLNDGMSITQYTSTLSGKSRNLIIFDLTVPATAKAKIYSINVNVEYYILGGGGGNVSDTISIKIENPNKQPDISVMEVEIPGEKLPSGDSSPVRIQVKNAGDVALKNLEFKLSGFDSKTINLDKWSAVQHLAQLSPGKTAAVEYRLIADSKLEKGVYPLELAIKYQDDYGQEYTQESTVYLPVSGTSGSGDEDYTPRLIVDNYYYPGDYVQPGTAFPLDISFYNTSTATAIGNIKVSINSDGDVFSPVGGSNSFYIEKMEAGGRVAKNLTLKPRNDAENGNYNISVDLQYQDSQGNQYNEKELISVPVNQNITLVVTDVETPMEAFVGVPTSISVDFYNTGRSVIRNLIVKTEGSFHIQDGQSYMGNLEAGKASYFDVTITPQEEGEAAGKIILEYEDNIGQSFMVERPFTINAALQPSFDENFEGMFPEENTPGQAFPKKWMIAAGAGVLLLIIAVVVIRRRRRRLSEELEFDE